MSSARDRTRLRISEAARAEFLEQGFDGAVIESIVTRAGVSRATFYIHFESKIDVLVEVWHSLIESGVVKVIESFDALGPFPEKPALRAWLDSAVAYWESTADINELSERALALDPQVTHAWIARNQNAVDGMHHYLSRFPAEELPVARMRIGMLLLQLDRMCFVLTRGALPQSRDILIDALTEEWWALLRTE